MSLIESYDGYFAPDTIISVSISRAHWLKISAEVAQLRGTLSLAEEGLANYAQENEQLREEIEVLRLYGNKDCTAMGDGELRRRRAEPQSDKP